MIQRQGYKKVKKSTGRLETLVKVNEKLLTPFLTQEFPTVGDLILEITKADPSNMEVNGKMVYKMAYTQWLIKQYVNKLFLLEDVERVKEDLTQYISNINNFEVKDRDINRFTYSELKLFLAEKFPQDIVLEHVIHDENVEVLYDGILGTLYHPLTKEGACLVGRGTKWCTAADNYNMFDRYNGDGPIYTWIDKQRNNAKYQFHFESLQFMDAQDIQINGELLYEYCFKHPVIKQLFIDYEKKLISRIVSNLDEYDDSISKYAKSITSRTNVRNRRLESLLLETKSPKYIFSYITSVIKGRWLEAEPYIMKDISLAYAYARDVIKGRWPEAEPYIMKDPHRADNYARDVIKGRWPEAEPYIMKEPHLACYYARDIIKGRWKEAEPYIMKVPLYAYLYAKDVIHDRWEEAESYIMADPKYAYLYAKDVMRLSMRELTPYYMKKLNQ